MTKASAAIAAWRLFILAMPIQSHSNPPTRIVVIGAGPIGVRFAHELNSRQQHFYITLFGDEPRAPYNRVNLSGYLAGECNEASLNLNQPGRSNSAIDQRIGCAIVGIDRYARVVVDDSGERFAYDYLVLATGSRPHIPNIKGLEKPGVFTFRDLDDAEKLAARRLRSRDTVIIGGGLLGLETARAMRRFNTSITVVEHTPRLMFRQLDDDASDCLRAQVEATQIKVVTGVPITRVEGRGTVETVCLGDGAELPCDTLIVAAGITPNIELARTSGIAVGRGIRVDDEMRTSDPRVFAIGECAEHNGLVYGLVAPGWEQAAIASSVLAGEHAKYHGSAQATQLKVLSIPVLSAGDAADSDKPVHRLSHQADDRHYRRLNIYRGRALGACGVGEWSEFGRVQELIKRGAYLWPWQRRRFSKTGHLWPQADAGSAANWPAEATICNCTSVTRGQIAQAMRAGHQSVATLRDNTRASSVCGSCRPLLEQILGHDARSEAAPAWRSLAALSVLVLLAMGLFGLAPAAPYADSVQVAWNWNALWQHTVLKENSGPLAHHRPSELGFLQESSAHRRHADWLRRVHGPPWPRPYMRQQR